jgi:hypothetical protein
MIDPAVYLQGFGVSGRNIMPYTELFMPFLKLNLSVLASESPCTQWAASQVYLHPNSTPTRGHKVVGDEGMQTVVLCS